MPLFDPVKFTWKGAEYVIPPNRVLRAIAKVEEIITLQDLDRESSGGSVPLAKLAMAYGAVLRYAGATVEDDEIYAAMFSAEGANSSAAIQGLLMMMLPKPVRDKLEEQIKGAEGAPEGNAPAATTEPAL